MVDYEGDSKVVCSIEKKILTITLLLMTLIHNTTNLYHVR